MSSPGERTVPLGPVGGGSVTLSGYLARPTGTAAGTGPWPGVVAIHEVLGLDDIMRRQCDRLAAAGFLTLGPDLFSDGGARKCLVSTFRDLRRGRGRAFADIEAARQALLARADCTGRVGVIGFCMGGAFALVASTSGFDAASANYGRLPAHPERALVGACPVIGSYGGSDAFMRGQGPKLDRALSTAGVEHEVTVYPGAGHSFLNDAPFGGTVLGPVLKVLKVGPEPSAAAAAWARIDAFFDTHLREKS